jgi:tetratricopeptide (TPR) repeat protein
MPDFHINPDVGPDQEETKNTNRFDLDRKDSMHAGPALPLEMAQRAIDKFDGKVGLASADFGVVQTETKSAPDAMDSFLRAAQACYDKKETVIAQNMYRNILRIDANNEVAIRGAAMSAKALGRVEEAVQILKSLIRVNASSQNKILLANELYNMDFNGEALRWYQEILQDQTLKPDVLFEVLKQIGNLYLRMGDFDAAEEHYNRAFTLQPQSDVLATNYGSLALCKGDLNLAVKKYREAVEFNPKNEKGWIGLAVIHRKFGDSELAWANLEKALDLDASNGPAIRLLSEWALKDNELERALRRLHAYLSICDQDAVVSLLHAKFLYFVGRLDEAILEAEKAAELDPHLTEALETLRIFEQNKLERMLRMEK